MLFVQELSGLWLILYTALDEVTCFRQFMVISQHLINLVLNLRSHHLSPFESSRDANDPRRHSQRNARAATRGESSPARACRTGRGLSGASAEERGLAGPAVSSADEEQNVALGGEAARTSSGPRAARSMSWASRKSCRSWREARPTTSQYGLERLSKASRRRRTCTDAFSIASELKYSFWSRCNISTRCRDNTNCQSTNQKASRFAWWNDTKMEIFENNIKGLKCRWKTSWSRREML
jgi:hypothetical protein